MSEPENEAPPAGEQVPPEVPDFDLIRPVGRGGFGEVWLATNRTTGKLCAIKIIPLRQPGQADPATREIASLTRLEANLGCQHPEPVDDSPRWQDSQLSVLRHGSGG